MMIDDFHRKFETEFDDTKLVEIEEAIGLGKKGQKMKANKKGNNRMCF